MKRNTLKTILTLFILAIISATTASAQTNPAQAQFRKALDFDGDGKADLTVVRKTQNGSYNWYSRNSTSGGIARSGQWGVASSGNTYPYDFSVAGDYDGDGKGDYAIARAGDNKMVWYILNSNGSGYRAVQFGLQNDHPVQGDYDGDGKTDIAVWRYSSGFFLDYYIIQSSNNQLVFRHVPYPADGNGSCGGEPGMDIDGDRKQDIALVCDTSAGAYFWAITRSSDSVVERYTWGVYNANLDAIAPADYDGDGKTDIAVVRNGQNGNDYNYTWYIRRSSDGSLYTVRFGGSVFTVSYDTPVPADYDGDGKADIAVYRIIYNGSSANQYLYLLRSGAGNAFQAIPWGIPGDQPLTIEPTAFQFF